MKRIIVTLIAILTVGAAIAQAPESFKYQAVVRDATGEIIPDQLTGVQFRILQGGSSGTPVYTETHTTTTNSYGLMSLGVGNGTVSSGSFSGIDWSAGPYFLEVSMDVTGGTSYELMGSSQLLSVPYALQAGSLSGGGGDPSSTNELNTSATLTGTDLNITDPGGTLTVDLSTIAGGDDADADPTNEYNTSVNLSGTDLEVTDGGGTLTADLSSLQDGVDDADADPTNEYNTGANLTGTDLNIIDGGGTITVDMSSLSGGGGNWTLSGSDIYNNNSGNVGVGTTSPTSQFQVDATTTTASPDAVSIVMDNPSGTANTSGINVQASSTTGTTIEVNGVYAEGTASGGSWSRGVYGIGSGSTSTNRGMQGVTSASGSDSNTGVSGFADGTATGSNNGLVGVAENSSSDNNGVFAWGEGTSPENNGIFALSTGTGTTVRYTGVDAWTDGVGQENVGVTGQSDGTGVFNIGTEGQAQGTGGDYQIGIWGETGEGGDLLNYAGYFIGDVNVAGNLSKTGGTFKIDHPQDPANKYLIHSFVESPDMMNIYNGNATTDAEGYVTVTLPDYFEAANKDFRYQLTVIGTFAQAIVKEKISGNTFVIQTNEPNVEVSWQVTGVRADKWAEENRVVPEVDKEVPGTYLHPDLHNAPEEQRVMYREKKKTKEIKSKKPKK